MLIYASMLIPLGTAIVLYVYFKRMTLWWELLIPVVASFFLCLMMKMLVEHAQVKDTEWWTGFVLTSEYYEAWDERVSCRHPKYKTVTDSKGNTTTVQDGYEHPYDVDYHPPYWQVNDNNGQSVNVSSAWHQRLVSKFGNNKYVNLNRNYHSINGNKYVTMWNGDLDILEVCTTEHTYKNRIIASNSVFKFPEPSSKEGLFDYPKVSNHYNTPFILGADNAVAERKLSVWNALNGKDKQCRLMFLVYQNMPIDVAIEQQNYWQGGKKNEFIVAIGTNESNEVKWCYVISWTEQELLKVQVRDFILSQDKLDLTAAVDWVGNSVKASFARKHFKDFDYLTVEPPLWTVFLTFFLTLALNVGISYWIITNELE